MDREELPQRREAPAVLDGSGEPGSASPSAHIISGSPVSGIIGTANASSGSTEARSAVV
jgi:hypothetical protein